MNLHSLYFASYYHNSCGIKQLAFKTSLTAKVPFHANQYFCSLKVLGTGCWLLNWHTFSTDA